MEHQEESLLSFVAEPEDTSLRLDKLLSTRFPTYSRSYFQFLIEEQAVHINGTFPKKRAFVQAGDHIDIHLILTEELSVEPEAIPLDILYEDEDLLVVNKPAGMVVHPAVGHPKGTFANALLFHCQSLAGLDPLRPGIVHRLDKDTSGVLMAAKHARAHSALVSLFQERAIRKEYLAICCGKPKEGLLQAAIARHPTRRQEMCVDNERGKVAESIIHVLEYREPISYVRIELLTGRTHQIRVHLKHLHAPVLGDPLYGSSAMNQKFKTSRQLLHAHRLSFQHPFKKKTIEITAPLPHEMGDFLKKLHLAEITTFGYDGV